MNLTIEDDGKKRYDSVEVAWDLTPYPVGFPYTDLTHITSYGSDTVVALTNLRDGIAIARKYIDEALAETEKALQLATKNQKPEPPTLPVPPDDTLEAAIAQCRVSYDGIEVVGSRSHAHGDKYAVVFLRGKGQPLLVPRTKLKILPAPAVEEHTFEGDEWQVLLQAVHEGRVLFDSICVTHLLFDAGRAEYVRIVRDGHDDRVVRRDELTILPERPKPTKGTEDPPPEITRDALDDRIKAFAAATGHAARYIAVTKGQWAAISYWFTDPGIVTGAVVPGKLQGLVLLGVNSPEFYLA